MGIHAIYDARRGEDFRFKRDAGTFSSLEHGFVVLDTTMELNWDKRAEFLSLCIRRTSNLGFFTLDPWIPGAKRLRARVKQDFESLSDCKGTLAGHFDAMSDAVARLLAIRREFGGDKSGEWGIGGCSVVLDPPRAKNGKWGFSHLLGQSSKIGCLLYLGEMHQTTFMTKVFEGLDPYISMESLAE